jgi:hypothetical protein
MKKLLSGWGMTGLWVVAFAFAPIASAQPSQDITTEFVFEIAAQIEGAISTGETKDGIRQAIPITGGTFEGPGIKGEVIPGGADWQQVRPDGVVQIEAIYMIRTDDGAVISVRNAGLINRDADPAYFRTVPEFAAPVGKYDWLNKHIFLCSVRVDPARPGFVFIRVYKVL